MLTCLFILGCIKFLMENYKHNIIKKYIFQKNICSLARLHMHFRIISCCDIYALCECIAHLYMLWLGPFSMVFMPLKLVNFLLLEFCRCFGLFLYFWKVFLCNNFLLLECKWQNNHRMLIKSCWLKKIIVYMILNQIGRIFLMSCFDMIDCRTSGMVVWW